MKLLVGLGNPGSDYAKNRHNVGFLFIDYLLSTPPFKNEQLKKEPKFHGEYCKISPGNETNQEYILLKPTTFMNRSGDAVQRIMQFFKIKPEDVFVIHDDLDMRVGQFKISEKGPPIHNGTNSINNAIGNNYIKVRIGVDNRPFAKDNNGIRIPGETYVLQNFTTEEIQTVEKVFPKIAQRILE